MESSKTEPNIDEKQTEGSLAEEKELPKDKEKAAEAKLEGNRLFKQKEFASALKQFGLAASLCPPEEKRDLAIYHCNAALCYAKLEDWEEATVSCTEAIKSDAEFAKAYARRSQCYEKQDKPVESYEDMKKAAELDKSKKLYAVEAVRLSKIAKERQEKMKDEMIGKLKDLGNMFLGNFGMSIDDFAAKKDPNTGSYSISFGKGKK